MNKKIIVLVIICINIILNNVFAFGIASNYYNGRELVMQPGERKIIELGKLQNMLENASDMVISARIVQGRDIAWLVDDYNIYKVPHGVKNKSVYIEIIIPENVINQTRYNVIVEFEDITEVSGEGMVAINTRTKKSLPIVVYSKMDTMSLRTETINGYGRMIFYFISLTLFIGIIIVCYLIIKNYLGKKDSFNEYY